MVDRIDAHTVKINGSFIKDVTVDNEFIRRIRASYYLIGALLGKYKKAEVALPGGCDIGSRPIDLHIKGFRAMGADVDIAHGLVIAEAEKLNGTHIYLDKVSVGATINIMMAASMAEGKTVIENAYLALLVWCILFKFALRPEEIPHLRGINLIPYAASVVVNGKVQISEIIENMLVFLPFGLCISAFYPDSEIQNRILLASGLSLFFGNPLTQYIFAIRRESDITDVIDNTLAR